MKKLGSFKNSLLVSAVTLSVLSSPANAVSEEVVRKYLKQNCGTNYNLESEALNKLRALVDDQWTQFKTTVQALMTADMGGYDRAPVIQALGKVTPQKWSEFISTAQSLMTPDMSGFHRAQVIRALGDVAPEKWTEFTSTATSLMTADMAGYHRAWVITSLGKVAPQKWSEFISTAQALMTPDMSGFHRAWVITSLGKVAPEKWTEFTTTAQALMTPDMRGLNRTAVINALGKVTQDKIERVYSKIQQLMSETQGKIQFERSDAGRLLIRHLQDCDTDERAAAFTNCLIQLVNESTGNVSDDVFLTHMNTAGDRVQGATQNELQDLARQRQSTHKKEVHESVAESVGRLQLRYKDQLPKGSIFEDVQAMLMSVVPSNMETLLGDAVDAAKKLVDPREINRLIGISPHTRAGENNEDTALNVAARGLWAGKSIEAQKAIQELVRLQSHKNALTDAEKLLKTLKDNPTFKDGISQLGYEPLLRLTYASITDENWGEVKDIPGRWKSLLTRMVRAHNEYRENKEVCLAGIFNALLEPLSGVHPDVLIIHSFRLMMQEIALEEDNAEFGRRVNHVLSYLGENAANDKDYKAEIEASKAARQARQDQEGQLLEKLKVDLTSLKALSDEEFGAAVAALVKELPERLQEQKLLWNTLIVQERKARAEEQSRVTTPAGSSDAIEDAPPLPRPGLAPSTSAREEMTQ